MAFPLLGLLGSALGLGSLVTSGPLSNFLTTASAAKTAFDQLNYDPKDLSVGEEVLGRAKLASGVFSPLIPKKSEIFKEEDPFFDPGLGSPPPFDPLDPQNFPPGQGRPPTPAPRGTGIDPLPPVTREDLPAPEPFDFGFDPSLTADGGFGFFNQGGLVSLVPRPATPAHSPPISYRRY